MVGPGKAADMDRMSRNVADRLDPAKVLPGVRTVMSLESATASGGRTLARRQLRPGRDDHIPVSDRRFEPRPLASYTPAHRPRWPRSRRRIFERWRPASPSLGRNTTAFGATPSSCWGRNAIRPAGAARAPVRRLEPARRWRRPLGAGA